MALPYPRVRVCIDRGGTFTDIYATITASPGSPPTPVVLKLLSVDPSSYADAPTEGIRRVLQQATGKPLPPGPVSTAHLDEIRMGTTVATNALLERAGAPTAFVTTAGLRDVLEIGNQARPDIFDIKVRKPAPLYAEVVEARERVRVVVPPPGGGGGSEEALRLEVAQPLDEVALRAELQVVHARGVRSLAVALMHSYGKPVHERAVERVARSVGFEHVSVSSALTPMVKLVPRGFTSVVDAYLTPKIREYIANFRAGFVNNLDGVRVQFMRSDGGLCSMDDFSGYLAILSGPAGGVVGFSKTAFAYSRLQAEKASSAAVVAGREAQVSVEPQPVIGFDMGGTSTDVSTFRGRLEHVFETETAGVTIQAPQLDISTVAAGGGSRLFARAGMFDVGPESAGASPGPVCYRRGGYLAVTDANLLLGRIIPELFPTIFGPGADEPLDVKATQLAFSEVADEINAQSDESSGKLTREEVACGFIKVANEAMCRPIRQLTEAKGYDVRKHILACFGGAGGQHACAIARSLGITTVFVHKYSSILSAFGIALADSVVEVQQPLGGTYTECFEQAMKILDAASTEATEALEARGFSRSSISTVSFLNLRYDGTVVALMVDGESAPRAGGDSLHSRPDFAAAFIEMYHHEHGFSITDRAIIIEDVRVRGTGMSTSTESELAAAAAVSDDSVVDGAGAPLVPVMETSSYFEQTGGFIATAVYRRESLVAGGPRAAGPCIIVADDSTIVIEPGCIARVVSTGDLVIDVDVGVAAVQQQKLSDAADIVGSMHEESVDLVRRSVMSHRFMGIAEQMGRTLQRSAISTNIKERLDFSCALFGPNGALVANAPHIPVHLGSMQEAVRHQNQLLGSSWKEGEVLLSNHPVAGGTHLPDVTVITPVYHDGSVVFYVASRGHQADIGGITPGSMPPFSKSLQDEGMAVESMKVVKDGAFQEAELLRLLERAGGRCNSDVLSDIRAQVAANKKGISLVGDLIESEGLSVVHAYMHHIQTAASDAVRNLLRRVSIERGLAPIDVIRAEDFMDDGTAIRLAVTINRDAGTAVFDFENTGAAVSGNLNAPRVIASSAILYSLRLMLADPIPMNQGCLDPVTVKLPPNSLINPGAECAVAGGNVLTSQRLVDVILRAFGACAASQGCMGNFTFGNETMGYYETIAGGSGAGPDWHGASGVQCHMTNTKATDCEVLERRYPVVVRRWNIRRGSGGRGLFCGGDGVVRELEFTANVTASLLTERRVYAPWGANGGNDGKKGVNTLIKNSAKGGGEIDLTGKATLNVEAGDVVRICTPGGGGFGA